MQGRNQDYERGITLSYEKRRGERPIVLPPDTIQNHPNLPPSNVDFKILRSSKEVSRTQDLQKHRQHNIREPFNSQTSDLTERARSRSPMTPRPNNSYEMQGVDWIARVEKLELERENLHLKNKELVKRLSYFEKNAGKVNEKVSELEAQNKKMKFILSKQSESLAHLQQVLLEKDAMIRSMAELNSKIDLLKQVTHSSSRTNLFSSLRGHTNFGISAPMAKRSEEMINPNLISDPVKTSSGDYVNLLDLKFEDSHLQSLNQVLSNIKSNNDRTEKSTPTKQINDFGDFSDFLGGYPPRDSSKDGIVLGSQKNFTFQNYANII